MTLTYHVLVFQVRNVMFLSQCLMSTVRRVALVQLDHQLGLDIQTIRNNFLNSRAVHRWHSAMYGLNFGSRGRRPWCGTE